MAELKIDHEFAEMIQTARVLLEKSIEAGTRQDAEGEKHVDMSTASLFLAGHLREWRKHILSASTPAEREKTQRNSYCVWEPDGDSAHGNNTQCGGWHKDGDALTEHDGIAPGYEVCPKCKGIIIRTLRASTPAPEEWCECKVVEVGRDGVLVMLANDGFRFETIRHRRDRYCGYCGRKIKEVS